MSQLRKPANSLKGDPALLLAPPLGSGLPFKGRKGLIPYMN